MAATQPTLRSSTPQMGISKLSTKLTKAEQETWDVLSAPPKRRIHPKELFIISAARSAGKSYFVELLEEYNREMQLATAMWEESHRKIAAQLAVPAEFLGKR